MTNKLSDFIIESGSDWDPTVMEDYSTRYNAEFKGKTQEEIRSIYLDEAIRSEEEDEIGDQIRQMEEDEENED